MLMAGAALAALADEPLRVTVYGDKGPCGSCAHEWYRIINDSPDMVVTVASGYMIRNTDILDRTDLFVCPGGNSSDIPTSLMWSGMEKFREWLKNGGRYFGTCAGCAILLQQEYYLALAPFVRIGSVPTGWGGNYGVDFSEAAAAALGMTAGRHAYRYAEGPIMAPGTPVAGSTITEWGTYCSEGSYDTQCSGVGRQMYGACAMFAGNYYEGRIFAIALHPEAYRSTHELILKGFKWLTGREVTIPKRKNRLKSVRVAVQTDYSNSTGIMMSPFILAADKDEAFDLVMASNTTLAGGVFEHVDAVVLPGSPALMSLGNPSTLVGQCMQEFINAGGKCFGWGENADIVRSYGSHGVVCESAEDTYRALREVYGVTTDPSIHLHSWTYETNSVLSCTTPCVVVQTCHTAGCPTGVKTNITAALGHDFGEWVVVTPSTEIARGIKRHVCKRSGCGFSEEKSIPKINETYYKVGVDPYGYSSFAKSYNATYGWADAPGGTVDPDHIVDPEVNYVVSEGARLRTPFSGQAHTFAGKSIKLAGVLCLNDTAGNSSKTINMGEMTVQGQSAVITVGNPTPRFTITGSLTIPDGQKLTVNMYAESSTRYAVDIASSLSGAGELAINGNPASYSYRSELTLGDAANFTGTILTTSSRDMNFSLNVTGGFGGSIASLPDGTTNLVFNYDGLDKTKGLPVATTSVPSALTNCLTFYSATADFSGDRFVLMSFPAGTRLDVGMFKVKHASVRGGTTTEFTALHAQESADGSVRLVANYCDHRWGKWMSTVEPTFTKAGCRRHVCSACSATGYEETERLPVPEGYAVVDYVEGDENQYIDTGIQIQDKITSDLSFKWTMVGNAYHMLGAWDKSDGNMREYLLTIGANNRWRCAIGNTAPVESATIPVAKVGVTNRVVTSVRGNVVSLSVNGASDVKEFPDSASLRRRTLYLFAYNEEGSAYSRSRAQLFEAAIYTNETVLARHYLPLYRTETKTFGLWDAVTGTFKASAGTKGFIGEEPVPPNPVVDGKEVDPKAVFDVATSKKPIVYPEPVTLTGEPGLQNVVFKGNVTAVPTHYTASLDVSGMVLSLTLNDAAKPCIAGDDTANPPVEPIAIKNGMVTIHVGNVIPTLYYALGFADTLDGVWTTNAYEKGRSDFEDTPGVGVDARFYQVYTTDTP